MKRIVAFLLAATVAITTAGCVPTKKPAEEKLLKLTVSEVARSVFYAPQYAALSQGFFREEGLDVELVTGQGADKVMTSVIAGQAEIGLSGPEAAIYVYKEGKENHAVVFAQLTKRDGSFLVGRKPVESFTWESLRGATILGGRKGGVPEMTLEYVLRQNGLTPNTDVTVDTGVQFALMAGAFTGGQGDYVTLFEPTASAVELEGKGTVLCSIGTESGEIPYTCYYASKNYIKDHADTIQHFTNAIYKGQRWVREHTAREVAESIASFFPDTSLDLLEKVTQRHKDIDAFMTDPLLLEEPFNRLQTVIETAGQLNGRVEYGKIVDTTFAKKAMDSIR